MQVLVAESWSHAQEALFEGSWNEQLARFRSPWVFRGQSDAAWPVQAGLLTLAGADARIERHLIRNFIKYAAPAVVERDSIWHWLSLAQHHGLPTRLLDWTYSPLVALHFATGRPECAGLDGAVYAVNMEAAIALLPERLRQALAKEGANSFTTAMLADVAPSLEGFDGMSAEPSLLFFEPPSITERIVNQYALFSVMSSPVAGLDAWFAAHPSLCRKVVVPASLKDEIRDKLDQCNVTERVLFPGLDGLSRWLRRHYQPRGASLPPPEGP
jgi:hypothetical protein